MIPGNTEELTNSLEKRLEAAERALYAMRSSSTWKLALSIQRVTGIFHRLIRRQFAAHPMSVRVIRIGPTIEMMLGVKSSKGLADLVLSLAVGPTELLQQPLNLLTHENLDDSDIHVTSDGPDKWLVTWKPSIPIGDYHAGELSVRLVGLPNSMVTYDFPEHFKSGEAGHQEPERASVAHLLNSVREVRPLEPGGFDPSSRFAVISTFTPKGRPLGAVLELLRSLRAAGVKTIVIDTSPGWGLGNHPALADLASVYVRRANVGWDFSSWIAAHTHPDLSEIIAGARELIWINDSCYGPFVPMIEILERADTSNCDLWGLASSNQVKPHIQSFFLRFSQNALTAGLIDEFIAGYPFPTVKSDIILEGEVRMTEVAKQLGLSVGVGYSYEQVVDHYLSTWDERMARLRKDPIVNAYEQAGTLSDCTRYMYHLTLRDAVENGIPRNASHEMWDSLLQMGFPMVKRELVMSNPQKVPLAALPKAVEEASPVWAAIIRGERTLSS